MLDSCLRNLILMINLATPEDHGDRVITFSSHVRHPQLAHIQTTLSRTALSGVACLTHWLRVLLEVE